MNSSLFAQSDIIKFSMLQIERTEVLYRDIFSVPIKVTHFLQHVVEGVNDIVVPAIVSQRLFNQWQIGDDDLMQFEQGIVFDIERYLG